MKVYEMQEVEAATESFSPSRLIGKGSHGSVYRGVLKDGKHVAVKRQSSALQKLGDNTKLLNEAHILSSLSPNPCIIQLLGHAHKFIVTQYMPNGTLHDILHSLTTALQWRPRLQIAIQLAEGLRFLHGSNPPIVHRDIKSANILLDENWNAKLGDFGLAMRLGSEEKLPAGTIGYIDPSYTTHTQLTTKIDVYSYGVVLLELISGRKVIDMHNSPASIVDWALPLIERGRMMEVCDQKIHWPRRKVEQYLGVAARCLSPEQTSRPLMDEIVENLIGVPAALSMINSIQEMIVSMIRGRKLKFGGGMGIGMGRSVDSSNMCKGTLLVREILALK